MYHSNVKILNIFFVNTNQILKHANKIMKNSMYFCVILVFFILTEQNTARLVRMWCLF